MQPQIRIPRYEALSKARQVIDGLGEVVKLECAFLGVLLAGTIVYAVCGFIASLLSREWFGLVGYFIPILVTYFGSFMLGFAYVNGFHSRRHEKWRHLFGIFFLSVALYVMLYHLAELAVYRGIIPRVFVVELSWFIPIAASLFATFHGGVGCGLDS
jgi:hypothetical protein